MKRLRALHQVIALAVVFGLQLPSTLIAESSTPPARATDRSTNFVETTLRLLTPQSVKLGQAVEISLSAKNTGDQRVQIIPGEAGSWDDFIVIGPGGRAVPYVGGGVQLVAWKRPLDPNGSITLLEKYDVTDKYLISASGDYSIQFRGRHPTPMFRETAAFQPSSTVSFTVEKGELPFRDDLAARVLGVLPKGWYIGKSSRGMHEVTPLGRKSRPGAFTYLCDGLKAHIIWVWLTSEPAIEATDSEHKNASRYVGQGKLGHFYIAIGDEKAWPEAEETLKAALLK